MKTIYIILSLFFFHCFSFSQDSIRLNAEKKYEILIKVGGYYKSFFGNRYIEPTSYQSNDEFEVHQYERFTKIPTFGFQGGGLVSCKVYKELYITLGLIFCNRKDIFENNQDTVIKYGNGSTIRNIENVVKYDYTYNNIELPVLILYKWKKINLQAGAHLSVFSFDNVTYTYVINNFPQLPNWVTSQKTIESVTVPLVLYPTFQASYGLRIKNFSANPFVGIDIGNKKSFYLQSGIIFLLK